LAWIKQKKPMLSMSQMNGGSPQLRSYLERRGGLKFCYLKGITSFSFWKLFPLKLPIIHIYFQTWRRIEETPNVSRICSKQIRVFLKTNYSSVWGYHLKSVAQNIPESSTEAFNVRKATSHQFQQSDHSKTKTCK